ncbi:MAG: LysR family transcriptional regulator, partial [Polaromonas sp.]
MNINNPLDNLPDMAVFARVVDAGSFSAAARQLGISPSAVSRQVARLEGVLRVRLLERTTRKLRLT